MRPAESTILKITESGDPLFICLTGIPVKKFPGLRRRIIPAVKKAGPRGPALRYSLYFTFSTSRAAPLPNAPQSDARPYFSFGKSVFMNVQQRDDEPRAGLSQRVAEGERAAPHVDPFEGRVIVVQLQLADAGQRLAREGLVQLDRADIGRR